MAQWVESLNSEDTLHLIPSTTQTGCGVTGLSSQHSEIEGSESQDHPQLLSEFEVSHMRSCLKEKAAPHSVAKGTKYIVASLVSFPSL